ncbi:hypothetical protein DSO57_1008151 [Entomophthora muscae]|uniref:Uncharacterized protein n=1 Tax=Entomophthora muscae TaxID=34485 RepID=A0ACC2SK54_9FUNG|nr:hypothetical protein DSO57_1008151 [Entomophthora muscae]
MPLHTETKLVFKTSRTSIYRVGHQNNGFNTLHLIMQSLLSRQVNIRFSLCMELLAASIELQLLDQAAEMANAGISWKLHPLPNGIHIELISYHVNTPLVVPYLVTFIETPPRHLPKCKHYLTKQLAYHRTSASCSPPSTSHYPRKTKSLFC